MQQILFDLDVIVGYKALGFAFDAVGEDRGDLGLEDRDVAELVRDQIDIGFYQINLLAVDLLVLDPPEQLKVCFSVQEGTDVVLVKELLEPSAHLFILIQIGDDLRMRVLRNVLLDVLLIVFQVLVCFSFNLFDGALSVLHQLLHVRDLLDCYVVVLELLLENCNCRFIRFGGHLLVELANALLHLVVVFVHVVDLVDYLFNPWDQVVLQVLYVLDGREFIESRLNFFHPIVRAI